MKVPVDIVVDLNEATVEYVFRGYLERLKADRWVRDGKLMEEHVTSHRYDAEIGGPEHPDFELVQTIQKLERLLKERKK